MKTIIVPTDFSVASVNAAYYAIDMALATGANISLIHVVSFPIAFSEIPVPSDTFDIMVDDAKAEMQKLQEKLVLHINRKIDISTSIVMGNLLDEINVLANGINPIAIIMGIHGAGATERKLFGSNAHSAMHNLHYPVMIIPDTANFKSIKKAALACDLNDIRETPPVDEIEHTIKLFNCTLEVINVSSPGENRYATLLTESLPVQNILAKFHPEFHFADNENIVAGIAEFISCKNIDLLLVVPKEHGFWGSLFHKSDSDELSVNLHIPIITLHSRGNDQIVEFATLANK